MRERILNDVKTAMKTGQKERLGTLRLITSSIKNADIEAEMKGKAALGDADILAVLGKMLKQRRDSVEQFNAGGRKDLADKELAEIAVIEAYLPKQMDDAAVQAAIAKVVSEVGATSAKDMGKVMGVLKERFAGQMDFGKASGLVKAALK